MSVEFSERYRGMNPIQLNQELQGMYAVLPKMEAVGELDVEAHLRGIGRIRDVFIQNSGLINAQSVDEIPADIVPDIERLVEPAIQADVRKDLELSKVLQGRMRVLLGFAQITPSFKSVILDDFEELCIFGIDNTPPEEYLSDRERLEAQFGWDQPETGGIFDPKTAPTLDRKAYIKEVQETQDMIEMQRKAFKAMGIPEDIDVIQLIESLPEEAEELKKMAFRHNLRRELLENWRHELSVVHGFSPSSLADAS